MNVCSIPVEMVAWFEKNGTPHPVRFRAAFDGSMETVVPIDRIIQMDREKLAGNRMIVYKCEIIIRNVKSIIKLKYDIDTCIWILFMR